MQLAEPLRLLVQALGPYAPELKEDFFHRLVPYFTQLHVVKGHVLWLTGDVADTLYLLESGILRATYDFPDTARVVTESMLPGTLAGEMTFLAASKRNATVVAERDCCLWRMDAKQLADLEEKEGPATARALRQVLLRVSAESADGEPENAADDKACELTYISPSVMQSSWAISSLDEAQHHRTIQNCSSASLA